VIVFLIFLPNLLWEIHSGYPTIALLHTVIGRKYATVSPLTYIGEQFLLVNPLAAPFWLAGLYFSFSIRKAANTPSWVMRIWPCWSK